MGNLNILIDKIQKVRAMNNRLWMDLLRLAVNSNPAKAQKILKKINANDLKISRLMKELL